MSTRTSVGSIGRTGVISLVQESLQQPGATKRPVTVLLGAPGSGASETHNTLADTFSAEYPCARINLSGQQSLLPRYALGLIALQLERRMAAYSPIRLPRLRLGLLASDRELTMTSLPDGRRSIKKVLNDFHQRAEARHHGDYLSGFLEVAGSAIGAPDGTPGVVSALVEGLSASSRRATNRRFTKHADWYGQHRLTQYDDGWEALVELNQWRHSGNEEKQRQLDRILFSAFLEDLRLHANGGSFRPSSFLLLLENADTDDGHRFLDLLLRARQENAVDPGRRCDPLTAVVSAHRWLPRWGPVTGDHWPWQPLDPDQLSLAGWDESRPPGHGEDAWWYPVRLRDLNRDEVRLRMELAARDSPAVAPFLHLAPFVHRFTNGIPRAVHQVLSLLERHRVPVGDSLEQDVWLRSLPDRSVPATAREATPAHVEGPKLVDLALWQLLRGFTPEETEILAECAACRDLSSAIQVRALPTALFNELRARWLLTPPSGPESDRFPSLHPWLRRLLLWRLAQLPHRWNTVHEALAQHFRDQRDGPQEMYHRLAIGQMDRVTEYLVEQFHELDATAWLATFNSVTSAPNSFPPASGPLDVFAGLLGASRSRTEVTLSSVARSLVAARWVWSDPLADPGGRLKDTLADGFGQLTRLSGRDVVVLLNEAEKYRHWR